MTTHHQEDIWRTYRQHSRTREIDLYIEHVLFNNTQLIEEGLLGDIGSSLKSIGGKVKDAISRYNPQELYNQAYAKIANQKDMLVQKHPKAAKLFKLAANPTNIRVALMAATLLGTLVGVDMGNAEQMLADLPEDDGGLADQLAQAAQSAENVRDGEDALDGTWYDLDTQQDTGNVQINYQGIDTHVDGLVQQGLLDQQAAEQIMKGIDMKSGIELGEFIEGMQLSAYDELKTQLETVIDMDETTITKNDHRFESYIKSSVTDKNGQELVISEHRHVFERSRIAGEDNIQVVDESSGLSFDIITVMDANINQLPPDKAEELWKLINDREMGGLGLKDTSDPMGGQFHIAKHAGGHGLPNHQVHDTAQPPQGFDVSQQFAHNTPLQENKRENHLIWEQYNLMTESGEQEKAKIQQQVDAHMKRMTHLAEILVQQAIRKQVPAGQTVTAKQL